MIKIVIIEDWTGHSMNLVCHFQFGQNKNLPFVFHCKMGMQLKLKIPIYRILDGQSPKNEFIEICYFLELYCLGAN